MRSKTWTWMLPVLVLPLSAGILLATPLPRDPDGLPANLEQYRTWKRATPKTKELPAPLDLLCRPAVGKEVIETSGNPHRKKFFNVYVNAAGQKAMMDTRKQEFPVGTVIVKEKLVHEKDEKPELLTIMIKRAAGYNRGAGNWQYAVAVNAGPITDQKKMDHCRSCHAYQKQGDYVFRSYLTKDQKTKRGKD